MSIARFQFPPELARFLRGEHRGRRFEYACARAANLKNAIEALGVPHTEVGAVRVNGEAATLQRIVREGDEVEVLAAAAAEADLPLARIDKRAIAHRLPERVAALHEHFTHCAGCDRVYWPGSHYERMRAALNKWGQIQISGNDDKPL